MPTVMVVFLLSLVLLTCFFLSLYVYIRGSVVTSEQHLSSLLFSVRDSIAGSMVLCWYANEYKVRASNVLHEAFTLPRVVCTRAGLRGQQRQHKNTRFAELAGKHFVDCMHAVPGGQLQR